MLWSYGYCVYKVMVFHWDDVTSLIVPGCTVIVILYCWSDVRVIPWSRVRVKVLTHCRVVVLVFTGPSLSLGGC